ncbi:MAG: recombinase family protein [Firmicutes bacterium]|nr:recombinase family protein [Bacillota bacterium]
MIALYIRLSQSDEDIGEYKSQSYSVENQRKLLYDYISEHSDLKNEESEEFIDDGYSGMTFGRPAFQRMLELIVRRQVNTVIVKDFSRFGRNYMEAADYLELLFPLLGVRFLSVADSYDSKDKSDRQMEVAVKNIVNTFYSRDLSRKIKSTVHMKRQNGEYVAAARPFGYLRCPENPSSVIIDTEAAAIVRYIFELACGGMNAGAIARRLNAEGVLTREAYNRSHHVYGKEKSFGEIGEYAGWDSAKVRDVISNETYAGTYIGQERTNIVPGFRKTEASGAPLRILNHHPPIVSMEVFRAAQECMNTVSRVPGRSNDYPLKGLLFCGFCGYAMWYSRNNGRGRFRCEHRAATGIDAGCMRKYTDEKELSETVFSAIRMWVSLVRIISGDAENAEQTRWNNLRLLRERADMADIEMKEIGKRKNTLCRAYSEGRIGKEEFLNQKEALTAKQSEIRTRSDEITACLGKLRSAGIISEPTELSKRVNLFENEKGLTRRIAESFIERVTVYDKRHIEITWQWHDVIINTFAKRGGVYRIGEIWRMRINERFSYSRWLAGKVARRKFL